MRISIIALLFIILTSASLTFTFQPGKSEYSTWTVDYDGPADFASIQEAINSPLVAAGDTIFVREGIYYENIKLNKTVSLIGENTNTTILNGGMGSRVVSVSANNSCISGFTITSGRYGVYIEESLWKDGSFAPNCTISNNKILDTTYCGIYLPFVHPSTQSGNWKILGNTIANSMYGIFFDGVYYWACTLKLEVFGNTITDNYVGLGIGWARDMNISKNTILNNDYGIRMEVCGSANIIENVVSNNNHGMYFLGLDAYAGWWQLGASKIAGNQITDNIDGIVFDWTRWSRYGGLVRSWGNDLIDNNITGNVGDALRLVGSSNNRISGNVISTSGGNGIDMDSFFYGGSDEMDPEIGVYTSSNNTISGNSIEAYQYGIHCVNSSGNRIYNNNFVSNVCTVNSTNMWDDGYPSGGNHWGDYVDADLFSGPSQDIAGSDDIWDHPYTIDTDNEDRYPLVKPWTPSPAERIRELTSVIERWNLPKGIENSLTSKLEGTLHLLWIGNEIATRHRLHGFMSHVEALRGKKLKSEQADYLLSKTREIRAIISGKRGE
jgi:parallel beta-helix repeat protein